MPGEGEGDGRIATKAWNWIAWFLITVKDYY
jgi:hypothetical protein